MIENIIQYIIIISALYGIYILIFRDFINFLENRREKQYIIKTFHGQKYLTKIKKKKKEFKIEHDELLI